MYRLPPPNATPQLGFTRLEPRATFVARAGPPTPPATVEITPDPDASLPVSPGRVAAPARAPPGASAPTTASAATSPVSRPRAAIRSARIGIPLSPLRHRPLPAKHQ